MLNRGDSPGGRFKASVTRALKPKAPAMAKAPAAPALPRAETPDTTLKTPAATVGGPMMRKAKKSRTFRFLGSFKNGGHVHKTGLYLMHAGEHVRPARLRKGGG